MIGESRPTPPDDQSDRDRLRKLNEEYRPGRSEASGVRRLGSAGVELGLGVAVMTLGGLWLDKKLDTLPLFVLVGAAVGITGGLYRLIRTFNQLMK